MAHLIHFFIFRFVVFILNHEMDPFQMERILIGSRDEKLA